MSVILSGGRRGDRSRKPALSVAEGDLRLLFAFYRMDWVPRPFRFFSRKGS